MWRFLEFNAGRLVSQEAAIEYKRKKNALGLNNLSKKNIIKLHH